MKHHIADIISFAALCICALNIYWNIQCARQIKRLHNAARNLWALRNP